MKQYSCERGNPVELTELMCFQANIVKQVQKLCVCLLTLVNETGLF